MLKNKIIRKIYGRLRAIAEGEREEIGYMSERLGIIESILLLYYYSNEEVLKNLQDLDDNEDIEI